VFVALADSRQYLQLEAEAEGIAGINDPFLTIGGSMSAAAGRLAYQLDLRGPVITVDTACSSALVAVDLAVQSLRRGECDQAVVCGSSAIIHPVFFVQFCKMGMLAPDGRAKVFDQAGNGYTLGEGGGAVVLTRASDAGRDGRRAHAVIRGSAVNSDGRSNGMTAPNKAAQIAVLRAALANAGLRPDDLDFLESQGTGSSLGDAIEFGALLEVFGGRSTDRPLLVGAVKSNIGHLVTSSGFASLIKAVLAVKRGEVPANLHLETPNPVVNLDGPVRPVRERQELRGAPDAPRRAGVSAFGWSGTNAHVIVEQVPTPAVETAQSPEWQLLTLSATGDAGLRAVAARLADHLESAESLADVARTVQTGRSALRTRRAVLCRDIPDAITALRGEISGVEAPGGKVAAGLVLAGATRSVELSEPEFQAALAECGDLDGPNVSAFAAEYALGKLLSARIPVAAVFGTGVGAYAAECVAGARKLADGLALAKALDGGATPIPAEPVGTPTIPLATSAEELAERVDVVVRFDAEVGRPEWLALLGLLWERGVPVT
jgi:acyl transferase domain-containing protein